MASFGVVSGIKVPLRAFSVAKRVLLYNLASGMQLIGVGSEDFRVKGKAGLQHKVQVIVRKQ